MSAALAPHDAGFTVWFTGLKGSGKGAVARLVAAELARRGLRTELLAGGEFRHNISRGLGFSREDRVANIRRIGYVAQLLTRNGVAVVTTSISPYREARDECRRMIGRFVEVFCDAPLEACEARDAEGLYRRARAGLIDDFTGISDPYEPPLAPEVTLRTVAAAGGAGVPGPRPPRRRPGRGAGARTAQGAAGPLARAPRGARAPSPRPRGAGGTNPFWHRTFDYPGR
ncbi:MAG TPA: adenylyl-sulfate kinase, partial [Longimicrobium sp.]|nr:adenylyl-sulfate kinase [Longimicrobium sp.]